MPADDGSRLVNEGGPAFVGLESNRVCARPCQGGRSVLITGAHSIIYSKNPEADRAFFRDVLGLPNVDVGHGWLIFGLPPSEVAVHPADQDGRHEFYLMCADIEAFVNTMKSSGIACRPIQDQGWGLLTQVMLPGGGQLGVYQPRHARPPANI
jgi:catechol 2,3-dioxygenase-like lactoylglutathione lyase family enzyme